MAYTVISTKKRIAVIFMIIIVAFIILIGRLFYLQIIKGEYYTQKARDIQTKDRIVNANRGTIYDATGTRKFAQSTSTNVISVVPSDIKDVEIVATKLSETLGLVKEEVLTKLKKQSSIEVIDRKVDKAKADEILKWKDEQKIKGIKIDQDVSRIYPYNNTLSHTLGFVGTDNQGLFGIEKYYDDILKGVPGRIVESTDVRGRETPFKQERYINPEDGMDLVLTVDLTVQQILEKTIKKTAIENVADQAIAIAMDVKTGGILGMANYPDFNLNEPFSPNTKELQDAWPNMDNSQKNTALLDMWRNKIISNTYEPGSTYKILTASIAIEEGVTVIDKPGDFSCTGSMLVPGWNKPIKCWRYYNPHGSQSLRKALMNSCNPAFMQLGMRIGINTYNKYIDAVKLNDKTGIDLMGEATGIFHDPKQMTVIDLATMSFGQGIQITPIQLANLTSGIANNGNLMKPYLVKEIKNQSGTYSEKIEPKIVKKLISDKTSQDVLSAMESVVAEGTASGAKVSGYRVGAKTGTGEQGRGDTKWYVASCTAVAPISNPRVNIVVAVYNPKGSLGYQGGMVAAPAVGQIMDEVLRYLNVEQDAAITQNNIQEILVPDVRNKTVAEAKEILTNAGFKVNTNANGATIVKDQTPKAGASLIKNSIIQLYTEGDTAVSSIKVPDVKGQSMLNAISTINRLGLNIRLVGTGTVVSQDPVAGTDIEPGSIVTVSFIDKKAATGD